MPTVTASVFVRLVPLYVLERCTSPAHSLAEFVTLGVIHPKGRQP